MKEYAVRENNMDSIEFYEKQIRNVKNKLENSSPLSGLYTALKATLRMPDNIWNNVNFEYKVFVDELFDFRIKDIRPLHHGEYINNKNALNYRFETRAECTDRLRLLITEFLKEIFLNENEMHSHAKYDALGLITFCIKKLLLNYGPDGDNAKTVYYELLNATLCGLLCDEAMLNGRVNGNTIVALAEKTFGWIDDPDMFLKWKINNIKNYIGAIHMVGRGNYQTKTTHRLCAQLAVNLNDLPMWNTVCKSFYNRFIVFIWKVRFVDINDMTKEDERNPYVKIRNKKFKDKEWIQQNRMPFFWYLLDHLEMFQHQDFAFNNQDSGIMGYEDFINEYEDLINIKSSGRNHFDQHIINGNINFEIKTNKLDKIAQSKNHRAIIKQQQNELGTYISKWFYANNIIKPATKQTFVYVKDIAEMLLRSDYWQNSVPQRLKGIYNDVESAINQLGRAKLLQIEEWRQYITCKKNRFFNVFIRTRLEHPNMNNINNQREDGRQTRWNNVRANNNNMNNYFQNDNLNNSQSSLMTNSTMDQSFNNSINNNNNNNNHNNNNNIHQNNSNINNNSNHNSNNNNDILYESFADDYDIDMNNNNINNNNNNNNANNNNINQNHQNNDNFNNNNICRSNQYTDNNTFQNSFQNSNNDNNNNMNNNNRNRNINNIQHNNNMNNNNINRNSNNFQHNNNMNHNNRNPNINNFQHNNNNIDNGIHIDNDDDGFNNNQPNIGKRMNPFSNDFIPSKKRRLN